MKPTLATIEAEQSPTDAVVEHPSMPTWRSALLGTLEMLALSVWLGGLLVIGAVVAPVAFHAARALPEIAGNSSAQAGFAGSVVGGTLRVFNTITYVCAIVLVAGALIRQHMAAFPVRIFAVVIASMITSELAMSLFPAMDKAQAAHQMAQFDALHHQYELLSQVQLALLIVFTVAYAWGVSKGKPSS